MFKIKQKHKKLKLFVKRVQTELWESGWGSQWIQAQDKTVYIDIKYQILRFPMNTSTVQHSLYKYKISNIEVPNEYKHRTKQFI